MMTHILIVGGTGMLSGCVVALRDAGNAVTTLARWGSVDGARAVYADYTDEGALRRALDEAVRDGGPIDAVIAWVHGSAPEAPLAIARQVRPARFVHVLGSAAAAPDVVAPERRAAFEALGIVYQEVILGFVVEPRAPGRSRWLTDAEIVAGTIGALGSGAARTIVGQVRPWTARPNGR